MTNLYFFNSVLLRISEFQSCRLRNKKFRWRIVFFVSGESQFSDVLSSEWKTRGRIARRRAPVATASKQFSCTYNMTRPGVFFVAFFVKSASLTIAMNRRAAKTGPGNMSLRTIPWTLVTRMNISGSMKNNVAPTTWIWGFLNLYKEN